jgi:hypothetical protein
MADTGDATLSDRLNPTHPAYDADLKRRWATMPKAERKAIVEADRQAIAARHASVEDIRHPFATDEEDHCETGAECFADIAPLLAQYAACLRRPQSTTKPSAADEEEDEDGDDEDEEESEEEVDDKEARASLKIYDPYYCTGAVVRHLGKLGFADVYNRCEDFYAAAEAGRTPAFDVLLTNPAYSGDHIPRLLDFVAREALAKDRAFALLMPAYVCGKDYYARAVERHPRLGEMAFLCPRKRYVYWTPAGLRSKRQAHSSALGNRTSPFVTFWYFHFGRHHQRVVQWWQAQVQRQRKASKNTKTKTKRKKNESESEDEDEEDEEEEEKKKAGGLLPDCVLARDVISLPKGVRPEAGRSGSGGPPLGGQKRRFEEAIGGGRGGRGGRGGGRGGRGGDGRGGSWRGGGRGGDRGGRGGRGRGAPSGDGGKRFKSHHLPSGGGATMRGASQGRHTRFD